jgi:DNA-binding NtrC family response regulator
MEQMSSRRILIIDDNVGLAENIAEILAMDGHVTDVAASAEEALSKVVPANPDVVVTDYRLPDDNGANLVRQIRHRGFHVRAVVISAYTDDRTMEDARSAGATFVPKPVDLTVLGRLVREQELPA